MLTPSPFYFLRHGETDWNKLKLMQGQTDTPLNATGIFQAEAAAGILASRKVVTICTSPLRRARHTAELVAAKSSVASIVTVEGLMESNFGSYEGHPGGPWRDAWAKGADIPGGESYENFLDRSLAALNECLKHPGPVLIVAHGGTFYAVRRWALNEASVKTGNCELLALSPPRKGAGGAWKLKRIFAPDGADVPVV
jgi:broad specificity phosphatase PhoE